MTNYGHFTRQPEDGAGILSFANAAGQDWYALVRSIAEHGATGAFLGSKVDEVFVAVLPASRAVRHVETDISRIVPDDLEVHGLPKGTKAEPGMLLVDGALLPAPPAAAPPLTVSAAQAKTALYQAGLYDGVEAAIGAHPNALMRIWWGSAREWRRDHPYVAGMAAEMGLSGPAVDALFEAARGVET